jgi:DNA-binding NarL/FixJ family response regulator
MVTEEGQFRAWVAAALRGTEFDVDARAATYDEAHAAASKTLPAVVLISVGQGPAAIDCLTGLRERGIEIPALLLTTSPERGLNEKARAAGAQGTVMAGSVGRLLAGLRAVERSEEAFDRRHAARPEIQPALSARERDVLRLVERGATNREIAGELGIGRETVKTLLGRSCVKLGVHGRDDAAAAARGLGFL